MLGLLEVLRLRSPYLHPKRTKLVRHKDPRLDMHLLKRQGWLDLYQGFQSRPIFHGCDTIVSFVGEEGRRSRERPALPISPSASSRLAASRSSKPGRCAGTSA